MDGSLIQRLFFLCQTGHSQGGILGRYWIKYLGGKGKVNKTIGVSPINHGTTLSNIITVAKAFGVFTSGQATFDKIAPSFYQMGNCVVHGIFESLT